MLEQKKSPAMAGTIGEAQDIAIPFEHHSTNPVVLTTIHAIERHFLGEPQLAYYWLVEQAVPAPTEPLEGEPLADYVSRLSFYEVCELEVVDG